MRRPVRTEAARPLPQGVKLAKWVPIVVIPSDGHNARAAGTQLANMRRQVTGTQNEHVVRLRYGACCDPHKADIKLGSLITATQLQALAQRLSMQHGHGNLRPQDAKLEWVQCEDELPCADCMAEAKEREEKAKGRVA